MNSRRIETPSFGGQRIREAKTLDGLVYREADGYLLELSMRDERVYVWMVWGPREPWVIRFDELESTGSWVSPGDLISAHSADRSAEVQAALDADFDRMFADITDVYEVRCG